MWKQQARIQNKTMIQEIKVLTQSANVLKPYILVELGNNLRTELALVDMGADINANSYETWEILGIPKLSKSTVTINTISGQTTSIKG